jgi:hypothetical protein
VEDKFEEDVRAVLAREDLPRDQRLTERNRIYEEARDRFRDQVQPTLRVTTYAVFAERNVPGPWPVRGAGDHDDPEQGPLAVSSE